MTDTEKITLRLQYLRFVAPRLNDDELNGRDCYSYGRTIAGRINLAAIAPARHYIFILDIYPSFLSHNYWWTFGLTNLERISE